MRLTLVSALIGLGVLAGATSASADTEGHWATVTDWSPTARTATIAVPGSTGFPRATLTSTTAGPAGPESGATRWLGTFTPPGATYGSSRDQQYLGLRPAANNATSPSSSVYTFERPTPAGGWALTLGDIDAEYLDISATGTDGQPVSVADLGFRSAFNYCQGSPRPSGCDASKAQPVPLWDASTARLAGPQVDPAGDPVPGWTDTDGAAAWLQPRVPLTSITVRSTWRAGFPTYQTWFSAASRDVSGTVTGTAACPAAGLDVDLRDGAGAVVASTTTSGTGAWSFDDVATYGDWSIVTAPPPGCAVAGVEAPTADLTTTDAVVDQILRASTGSVSGDVVGDDGRGTTGVEVVVTTPDGAETTLRTRGDGGYGPVDLPIGTSTVAVTAPAGQEVVGDARRAVTVAQDGQRLSADFRLRPEPATDTPVITPPTDDARGDAQPGRGDDGAEAPDDRSGVLPDTGGPHRWVPAVGLLLVAGGVVVVASARRTVAQPAKG